MDQPTRALCAAWHRLMVQHRERLVTPSPARVGTGTLLPTALPATAVASAPRTWEGSRRGVLVCKSSPCKDSNTYLDRYMGNEAGGQAHGATETPVWETATTPEQPPFIAAQLWPFLAHSGQRSCRCLVEVDVLFSTPPSGVPT